MASQNAKLKILDDVQKLLGVDDDNVKQIPDIVRTLLQTATREPCLVAFAFDITTGQMKQVALSNVPRAPEAYTRVAQASMFVAQQFQNIAVEVAKHVGEQGGVAESKQPRENAERRDGPGAERHGVGQVAVEGDCPGPPDE